MHRATINGKRTRTTRCTVRCWEDWRAALFPAESWTAKVRPVPARKPRPPDEKLQRERFIEAAREHGASEDPEEFERVFRQVVKAPVIPKADPPESQKTNGRGQ